MCVCVCVCVCVLDFSLKQPSTTSTAFHEVEDIQFPPVPDAVLQQDNVEDQITEMKKWFKAWTDQDSSERDYNAHFKPIMCYLEGAWVFSDMVDVDGSESERHFINADDYEDLHNQIK